MDERTKEPDRRGDRRKSPTTCRHMTRTRSADPLSKTEICEGRLVITAGAGIERGGVLVCEACGGVDRRGPEKRRARPQLRELEKRIVALEGRAIVEGVELEARLAALRSPSAELERAILELLPKFEQHLQELVRRVEEFDETKAGIEDMRYLNRQIGLLREQVGTIDELTGLRGSLAAVAKELDQKIEELAHRAGVPFHLASGPKRLRRPSRGSK